MDFKSWKAQNNNSDSSKDADKVKSNSQQSKSSAAKGKKEYEFVDEKINPADKAAIDEKINSYKNKSEDELTQELLATAAKLKGDGKLSKKDVDEFYEKAKGFLNEEQLAKLQSLIKMLGV